MAGCSATFTEISPGNSHEAQQAGVGTLLLIRLNSVQRIITGAFNCESVSATTSKTVRLTQGRFDLQ